MLWRKSARPPTSIPSAAPGEISTAVQTSRPLPTPLSNQVEHPFHPGVPSVFSPCAGRLWANGDSWTDGQTGTDSCVGKMLLTRGSWEFINKQSRLGCGVSHGAIYDPEDWCDIGWPPRRPCWEKSTWAYALYISVKIRKETLPVNPGGGALGEFFPC